MYEYIFVSSFLSEAQYTYISLMVKQLALSYLMLDRFEMRSPVKIYQDNIAATGMNRVLVQASRTCRLVLTNNKVHMALLLCSDRTIRSVLLDRAVFGHKQTCTIVGHCFFIDSKIVDLDQVAHLKKVILIILVRLRIVVRTPGPSHICGPQCGLNRHDTDM